MSGFPTSRIDAFDEEDILLVFQSANQDIRSGTVLLLKEYMEGQLSANFKNSLKSQYSTPSSGATVQVSDGSSNIHLILTPLATLATLTITLPAAENAIDKQEILVTSTQVLTALTVNINGASSGAGLPTTLSAGGFFKLKYDIVLSTWNRVG